MKRIDKIRNMSTKELAEFIINLDLCEVCRAVEKEIACIDCYSMNEVETYMKYFDMEV